MEVSRKAEPGSNSLWAALLFFALSWLFTVPAFTPRNWWAGMVAVACGAALCVLAFRKDRADRFDRGYAVLLVPLVTSIILIPFPYSLGPVLLSLGIAAGCLWRRAASAGMGLVVAGMVFCVQGVIVPFYTGFAARYHGSGLAAPAANVLLRIFGIQTSAGGSTVFVQAPRQVHAFLVSWEKLALLVIVQILVGGLVILLLTAGKKRNLIYLLLVVVAYALLRELFMTLVFVDSERLRIFWRPAFTILSLVPLGFILMKLFPVAGLPRPGSFTIDRRFWLLGASAFLCVSFLVAAWGYHDPGIRKQGRVLIDEKHSNWEWTTEKYDTKWYGEKSGYNYYSLYTYLDSFYKVDRNFKTLDPGTLSRYDVLMIKTPTEPFARSEVDSIEEFVRKGGGLFLVSDHTNVFGMSSFINPVAARFGLRFRYNATYDLSAGSLSEYNRPSLVPHPIVERMPMLLFATSCTLEVPPRAKTVIGGYGLKALDADYSQKNFFPKVGETPAMEFGSFVQAAAVNHGGGRVFAFTDSTMFSNFWMFMPAKPELAMGAVAWLNRKNSAGMLPAVFIVLGIAFLFASAYLVVKRRGLVSILVVLCAALLAVALVSHGLMALDMRNYRAERPRRDFTRVCFDQEHCDFTLPSTLEGFEADANNKYHSFYVWNQRLGYVPSLSPSLEDATENGDLVVMVNPVKPLTGKEKEHIVGYVKQGGRLLVLDNAVNRESRANEVLGLFGMQVKAEPIGRKVAFYEQDRSVTTTARACSVQGGRPLIRTEDGRSVLSVARSGRGIAAAFGDSHLFSDAQLGATGSFPGKSQMQISELEFWILRGLIKKQFIGER